MKELNRHFVNFCSYLDNRRWSAKNIYSGKGFKAYWGGCSRREKAVSSLVHHNAKQSFKCLCKASFLFSLMEKLSSKTTIQTFVNPIHKWAMTNKYSTRGYHLQRRMQSFQISLICWAIIVPQRLLRGSRLNSLSLKLVSRGMAQV